MPDRTSGGFGGKLRDARDRRGVSLRQIANATKISVAALEALERNDISRLPGGIFSRAFVRSYAVEVGLDPEMMIQEFIAQFPNDAVTAGHPTSGQVEDHQAVDSERRTAGTFLWLAVLSIPIAGAVLYFATAGRPPSRTVAPPAPAATPAESERGLEPPAAAAETSQSPAAAPAVPATEPVASPPSEQPPAAPPPRPTATSAETAADHLAVQVSALRPCWVSATVDGKREVDRLLQAGEKTTVDVRRELVLTAGDALAISLTLNGAEARPLGKSGEVVTARFNLANFRSYLQTR